MSKIFDIELLVRPNIRKLSPYRSARDDYDQGLLLDANENSLGAPYQDADGLHRYPSPHQAALRHKLARLRGVRPENVFVGVGSDEAIDLLYRIFCRPGHDRVMITPPTYGMYRVSANIHDVAVDETLLDDDFQPRPDQILENVTADTKLLFLCSPNNPTGNSFNEQMVGDILKEFPGLVILDEAYIDFSGRPSWADKVRKYPNLVVLQTMSKSFGLAGIRLGVAFASETIIRYMLKVKAPYNINALTGNAALKAFDHLDEIHNKIDAIKDERQRLRLQLEKLSLVRKVYPSDANFLLTKTDQAYELYQKLADKRIIVRYRGNEPLCEDCLRITVGTPKENKLLIDTIKQLTD